jgi:hypothetical protein
MYKCLKSIFMEAIPLCLLLNKLHLFSVTQHRFIIIQADYFYICTTCFGLYLGHPQACQYKSLTKEDIPFNNFVSKTEHSSF